MPGAARRSAVVIDAHEYEAGTPDCAHDDAADHAPCKECRSSKDAFVHGDEAREGAYNLVVVEDKDVGYAAEEASRLAAPGPHTAADMEE
jgi:hypothetical protein